MEKVTELVKQLISECEGNKVAVTIALSEVEGKTQVSHSGNRVGIWKNIEGIKESAATLITGDEGGCNCPICSSLKQAFGSGASYDHKDGKSPEVHIAEINSPEELQEVLKKVFGGK